MTEEVLQEWLSEYQSLDPTQLRSFAAEQEHNTDVMLGIFTLFEERNKYPQVSKNYFRIISEQNSNIIFYIILRNDKYKRYKFRFFKFQYIDN